MLEITNPTFGIQECTFRFYASTYSAIQNIVPDFVVGDPDRPHAPVA